jgi:hypothetical protein
MKATARLGTYLLALSLLTLGAWPERGSAQATFVPGGSPWPSAEQAGGTPRPFAEQPGMTLEQAAAQVQQQTGGRVLSADTREVGGERVHRIKVLLPNGHVRVVMVDAQGGESR